MTRPIVSQKTSAAESEGRLSKIFGIGRLCSALVIVCIFTAGMPTLIKDSALGSFDHHVVRLCACLSLIQILASTRSNSEEKNMKGEYLQGCRKMQKLGRKKVSNFLKFRENK